MRLVLTTLVGLLALPAAGAAAAGINGWTQTAALVNHNSGLEWGIQIVGHASIVDDAGTAYALGGSIWYAEDGDRGWTNYGVFRSPAWTFENRDINLTLHPADIHAFNYGGYLWFLGKDRDSTTYGLCLFRASVPYTEMQRVGCVQPYRSGYDAVLVNGYLYIVGGSGTTQVQYTKLNSNGTVAPWRATTGPPAPNYGYSAALDGRIYAIGVGNVIGSPDRRRVQSVPINADGSLGGWREEANQPPAQGPAVSIGNEIYIVGPQGGSGLTYYTTAGADGVLGPWQTSADILPVRSQHSVAVNGNKIIVIGGLRPGTGSWNQLASNAVLETATSSQLSDLELLARYKPELRYAIFETYRADSAAMATDNCVLDTAGRTVRQNFLHDSRGKVLAAACPADRAPDLSLGYLGSYAALLSDRLDEANSYPEDAQRLHGQGDYPNRTYGRVFEYPDGSKILQYWLFYYYNPKTYLTVGAHEGDWELAQVHLGPDGTPVRATYAQHGGGERCDWTNVQRTSVDRPIVYVAEGSHASYFSSGYHFNEGANDMADGNGGSVVPVVEDVTAAPSWVLWPGRWGGSGDNSPEGPAWQGDKWTNPAAWSATVDGCTEGQTQATGTARQTDMPERRKRSAMPPLPTVAAHRVGKRVVVRYRFSAFPGGKQRQPWLILTSVDPWGTKYPPLTIRSRVRGRRGRIDQPLGLGKEPYRLRVSVLSKTGRRSAIRTVRLR